MGGVFKRAAAAMTSGRFPAHLLLRKGLRRLGRELENLSRIRYETSFLVEIIDRNCIDLVVDIGANVGQWAAELRRAGYRGRYLSIEPVRVAHARLRERACGDPEWMVAPRLAVSDADGAATIYVTLNTPMSSLLPMEERTLRAVPGSSVCASESVRTKRLDALLVDYAEPHERIFVKIDTQGSEMAILKSAEASISRIHGVQVEMSLVPLYKGESSALELHRFLDSFGFRPVLVIPGYYSTELAQQLQVDGVFIRGA